MSNSAIIVRVVVLVLDFMKRSELGPRTTTRTSTSTSRTGTMLLPPAYCEPRSEVLASSGRLEIRIHACAAAESIVSHCRAAF